MATKRAKTVLDPQHRADMIEQLASDFIDAEMDDGARETLYEYIVVGCKGLRDYSDDELIEEYVEAYGKRALNKLRKG